jgi:hypothetical protein
MQLPVSSRASIALSKSLRFGEDLSKHFVARSHVDLHSGVLKTFIARTYLPSSLAECNLAHTYRLFFEQTSAWRQPPTGNK